MLPCGPPLSASACCSKLTYWGRHSGCHSCPSEAFWGWQVEKNKVTAWCAPHQGPVRVGAPRWWPHSGMRVTEGQAALFFLGVIITEVNPSPQLVPRASDSAWAKPRSVWLIHKGLQKARGRPRQAHATWAGETCEQPTSPLHSSHGLFFKK